MQSCDHDAFKRITSKYEETYKYVDYNQLSTLQKELLQNISGLWFGLHNVYYNIPVCKHPVGVDSLTKFINYLIVTEPERVRDFWLHATFMEVFTELMKTPNKYFAYIYLNDTDGFVFTGKSADIVNVPDDFEEIDIDPVLKNHLRVLPNTPGKVTTLEEFQKINNLSAQRNDIQSRCKRRRRSYRRHTIINPRRRTRY